MGRLHPRSIKYVDYQTKSDRELLKWIRHYPVLYDKKYAVSIYTVERTKIWEHIAYNLQSTAKDCEDRWLELLEHYQKSRTFNCTMNNVLIELIDQLNIFQSNIIVADPQTIQDCLDIRYMGQNEIFGEESYFYI